MSNPPEQPKSKFRDSFKAGWLKVEDVAHKGTSKLKKAFHRTPKPSPAPSPQPSRSPTPAPSNREGPPSGATAINPESAPSRVDNGEDSSKGGDSAQTGISGTAPPAPDPDWQAWKIDDNSISQLRSWGAGHENSNWRKLAEKIDLSLKSKTLEAVQDFIPDSPFPAKTLVKALLSIVQLGISVPAIQKKVYDFAQEAIEYIRTLVEVAGGEPSAREDLEAICTAVNGICKWASERVREYTPSAGDLEDWSSKFEKAKEMFSTRTLVKIRVEQANEQRKAFIKEKLASHVAAKHEYTDQSKSLCAPGTRREIQKEIEGWLSPQTSSSEHIFWITGIAGSGKSTLSATVVDNLRKKQTPVAAQFFISRNIPETIDTHKIIPTIAQQLSAFSPAAAQIIHDMLKHGLPPSQEEQVKALLLAPIQEICKSYGTVIILIDALDELQNAAKSVLQMLLQIAPKGCNLPDNIRFVITSRPEHWADISKSQTLELAVFKQHSLLTDSSVQEVSNFIHVKMDTILAEMREKDPIGWKSKWKDWPTEKQLRNLSEQANGLFHYAATALSWIEGQIDKHGTAAKQDFEKIAQKGLDPLNHLYGVILSSFKDLDPDRRPKQLLGFHHVLGTILVLREPLTIHQITALLADIPQDDFDVANFLKQFRSVLIPGMTTSFEEATPQMHKSFRDYITSAHAPVEFRILTGHAHFVTARSCLEVIVNKGGGDNPEKMYSVQYWHQHLQEAVNEGEKLEDEKRGKWLKQMADDERICNLLEQMVGDTAIDVWNTYSRRVFMAMATVGWKLLEQGTHEDRVKAISNIVRKAKELEELRLERLRFLEGGFGEREGFGERRFRRFLEGEEEREGERRREEEELEEGLVHIFPPILNFDLTGFFLSLPSRFLIPESATMGFFKRGKIGHLPLFKYLI